MAILDKEGVEATVPVGWSLGAQVAVELARRHVERVSALVTVCGVAGRPFDEPSDRDSFTNFFDVRSTVPSAVDWLSKRLGRVDRFRHFLRRVDNPSKWAKRFGLIDPMTDEGLFDRVIGEFLAIGVETYNRYSQVMAAHDAYPALKSFRFPVLAVAGERDLFISPERVRQMSEKLPRGEYFEVKGATHYLPLEYHILLALKVDDFIRHRTRR
jgi:pimeloyl-[acyl-carrier protein] methyl ester esterase